MERVNPRAGLTFAVGLAATRHSIVIIPLPIGGAPNGRTFSAAISPIVVQNILANAFGFP